MVDLSTLQSSPEAMSVSTSLATMLATLEIQNQNYEFLRDQNDFSSQASQLGAKATMASHQQQASQYRYQATEAFVQGTSQGAAMAVGHMYAAKEYNGQISQAQSKVDASGAYLNEINSRLANPQNRLHVVEVDGNGVAKQPAAPRSAQDEAQIARIKDRELNNIGDFERDANGQLRLRADDSRMMNAMNDDELRALKTKAQKANKDASKSLENLNTQKSNAIQQFNQIQQVIGSMGSGVTKAMSAASEETRAKQEYLRSLLQWIQEGMQTANQISNTAIGQQNDRLSGLQNMLSALVQSNRAN